MGQKRMRYNAEFKTQGGAIENAASGVLMEVMCDP